MKRWCRTLKPRREVCARSWKFRLTQPCSTIGLWRRPAHPDAKRASGRRAALHPVHRPMAKLLKGVWRLLPNLDRSVKALGYQA